MMTELKFLGKLSLSQLPSLIISNKTERSLNPPKNILGTKNTLKSIFKSCTNAQRLIWPQSSHTVCKLSCFSKVNNLYKQWLCNQSDDLNLINSPQFAVQSEH